ncbi:FUN14 domain-containing protein 1-like [Rhopilema esculentum]|uniref:FUN14 domain-containing protein 1-like n=1 Tax=Rhopilema esculentum TaxID=499914 RepID=UPI0031D8B82A
MTEFEERPVSVPTSESDEEDEEEYDELIEISRPSKSLMQQVLTLDLSRQPTYTQALVGGASGWVSGFAFSRVGKAMAAALGGSLLLIHFGSKAGYITVDWDRLDKDMKEAQSNIHKKLAGRQNKRATKNFLKQGTKFFTRNMVAVGGFLGGFFLGVAT